MNMPQKDQLPAKELRVSAIVPAFNEEKTVGDVVEVLLGCEEIHEVISVNDGSRDKTREILQSFGERISLIDFEVNHGKGFALAAGIRNAKGEIVVFIDSDLKHLSCEHIHSILAPIFQGKSQAVLGVPLKNNEEPCRPWCVYLTGERVYMRDRLLPHLSEMEKTRYGVEMYLNALFPKKEVSTVILTGVISPPKFEKRPYREAIKEYLVEAIEIAEEIGRKGGIVPEDYERLKKLITTPSLAKLKETILEIKNKKVKDFLTEYILKSTTFAKERVGDFRDILKLFRTHS